MKKLLIIAVLAFAVSAFAEYDITPRLNSTTVAASTTNTTAQTQPIGWGRGDVLTVQGTVTGTNAASGVLKFTLDTSLDTAYWQAGTHTFSLTSGAATTTTMLSLTNSDGSRWLRVKSMANTNAAAGGTITINAVKVHLN